jgi:phenylacetate-CoA ligase
LYRQITSGWEASAGELAHWPFITKRDIRQGFPGNFLGSEVDVEQLLNRGVVELEHTSGTSEERTALLLPHGWWAEQELRALRLNPLVAEVVRQNPQARRATINSPICSGDIRYTGVPSQDERTVGSSLFVSLSRFPFLWSERDLERMATEILDWNPEFLDIDPVYGVIFALYCERAGVRLPRLKFIVCSYEYVSVVHRSILARVFGVPVLDLYGSTETGHLLMEGADGRMQRSAQTAFLEMVDTDTHGIGELVVTTLTNPFMPLIRYRIGDLVRRSDAPCATSYVLQGRVADAFWISNEKRVTTRQVDQCFAKIDGMAHYQLIQKAGGHWLLKCVLQNSTSDHNPLADLQAQLSSLLAGPVTMQPTDLLVPESSGKFRLGYPLGNPRSSEP